MAGIKTGDAIWTWLLESRRGTQSGHDDEDQVSGHKVDLTWWAPRQVKECWNDGGYQDKQYKIDMVACTKTGEGKQRWHHGGHQTGIKRWHDGGPQEKKNKMDMIAGTKSEGTRWTWWRAPLRKLNRIIRNIDKLEISEQLQQGCYRHIWLWQRSHEKMTMRNGRFD